MFLVKNYLNEIKREMYSVRAVENGREICKLKIGDGRKFSGRDDDCRRRAILIFPSRKHVKIWNLRGIIGVLRDEFCPIRFHRLH